MKNLSLKEKLNLSPIKSPVNSPVLKRNLTSTPNPQQMTRNDRSTKMKTLCKFSKRGKTRATPRHNASLLESSQSSSSEVQFSDQIPMESIGKGEEKVKWDII